MCGKVEHARRALDAGCDIVVAQGTEAGGHTGQVATMPLVPQIVDAVGTEIPVVAAGGIFDGRGLAAALALGADGVWIGTRFIATPEAHGVAGYKDALIRTGEDGTTISRAYSGKTMRVVRNSYTAFYEEHPDELSPFPAQLGRSMRDGAFHLGGGEEHPDDRSRPRVLPDRPGCGCHPDPHPGRPAWWPRSWPRPSRSWPTSVDSGRRVTPLGPGATGTGVSESGRSWSTERSPARSPEMSVPVGAGGIVRPASRSPASGSRGHRECGRRRRGRIAARRSPTRSCRPATSASTPSPARRRRRRRRHRGQVLPEVAPPVPAVVPREGPAVADPVAQPVLDHPEREAGARACWASSQRSMPAGSGTSSHSSRDGSPCGRRPSGGPAAGNAGQPPGRRSRARARRACGGWGLA